MIRGSTSKKVQDRDRDVYQYLCAQQQKDGQFPTVRAVMQALHLSSPSMVEASFRRLEEEGLLVLKGRVRRIAGLEQGIAVPVLGKIAAGEPLMAVEHTDGYIQIDAALARGRALFALKIRGDSMIGAGILENDTVIVEQTSTVQNGEIAAVWLEDAATVKRFFQEENRIRLQPENDRLQPIYARELTVLGRVVALVRSYE